ncbi:MAG: putative alpha/beta superfamily hydrolase [Flavobacteriaceae bacterium]|jgi:predicted alpha/beta superfamily hydrolase
MKTFTTRFSVIASLLLSTFSYSQNADSIEVKSIDPYVIGDRVEIFSRELNENRVLNIYLPNGYWDDSSRVYPVIYVLDGSAHEDFQHIAGLVQFGSYSWINMVPESIVVGIENVDRTRDFTFLPEDKDLILENPTCGRSTAFMNFIEQEVQPYVEANYGTTKPRTLIGQSLGGLLAAELLLTRSHLFENYIIVSPSVWWDNDALLSLESTIETNPRIFLCVGDEDEKDIMKNGAINLFEKLKPLIREEHANFQYYEALNHGDALHLSVYRAFQFLFKPELMNWH